MGATLQPIPPEALWPDTLQPRQSWWHIITSKHAVKLFFVVVVREQVNVCVFPGCSTSCFPPPGFSSRYWDSFQLDEFLIFFCSCQHLHLVKSPHLYLSRSNEPIMFATWWHWSDVSALWLAAMLRDIYLVKAVVEAKLRVTCSASFVLLAYADDTRRMWICWVLPSLSEQKQYHAPWTLECCQSILPGWWKRSSF